MNFFKRNTIHKTSKRIMPLGAGVLLCCCLSACFTGIEGTKKINLSRVDKKFTAPTAEEEYMSGIKGVPLKEWEDGKKFIASDDKALLVLIPQRGISPAAPATLKGKELTFRGVESKINAAGNLDVAFLFDDGEYVYSYDSGKEFDDAMENFYSDRIPMLIDEEMVAKTRELLDGKKFWSRTNLWYDSLGNRINGRKYVEVTVTDVKPGNMVFPLWLKLITEDKEIAYLFMNFGNNDNESRGFHNLFSLNDIRKHYPDISTETWALISRGEVAEGMTKEECKLALGNPSDLSSGHDYSQTLDIWNYENGKVLWFEDGKLVKIRQ